MGFPHLTDPFVLGNLDDIAKNVPGTLSLHLLQAQLAIFF
jgi:hypothetical protein